MSRTSDFINEGGHSLENTRLVRSKKPAFAGFLALTLAMGAVWLIVLLTEFFFDTSRFTSATT